MPANDADPNSSAICIDAPSKAVPEGGRGLEREKLDLRAYL